MQCEVNLDRYAMSLMKTKINGQLWYLKYMGFIMLLLFFIEHQHLSATWQAWSIPDLYTFIV